MEHGNDTRPQPTGAHPSGAGTVVHDRGWTQDARTSAGCAGALFGLLLCVDWAAGSLTWWRGALWLLLALLLLLVLFPVRVSAGRNWLATRRLYRTRRVRTDLLTAVRPLDGVTQRLVLRDALGNRIEIDPEVLVRNPELWYRLHEGTRGSEAAGTLLSGATELHHLARRVDRETALGVFRASGLE
ncbi:hypothetical protein AQJ11_31510 [Streptomyces corchorusii]|uniref:Uncharacterized protein n=2 Tax=Streptomyces TaxID=1883 RepID=A0A101PX62_STRCK|nr:hypothetical protein [Streptomyces corchorusii]AEY88063.1 hypothetical protein SHJG_2789 [Streptomyces hygroscopicus subsp. jinggangensis 5008]AGF62219.1 hypothetical protein SHJGH_2553 [Streptomyces hygroscopicus subsp. jinggangensis TL01]KUN19312.1 hypothetical protein AQJ11_31510 [Streptomyces corchorusii]